MLEIREDPSQLATFLAGTDLFRNVPEGGRVAFAKAFHRIALPGGDALHCRGGDEDSLYVVRRGRVRVELRGAEQDVTLELARGAFFGELAVLCGAERSATVFAVRDTELLALSPEAFRAVANDHPSALWEMSRVLIDRFGSVLRGERHDQPMANLAVLPRTADASCAEAICDLGRALGELGPTLVLDGSELARELGPEAAEVEWDDPRNDAVVAWLDEQEGRHEFVLYAGRPQRDPWTSRCLRQADRILVVATPDTEPDFDSLRRQHVFEDRCTISDVRVEVLLLHPADAVLPRGGAVWRGPEETERLYHVRSGNLADYARVARCLTDRPVGVVLGGGGARGLAHIGAIDALEKSGIPIDVIGGTSVGSIFAAGPAMGWNAQEILERARRVFRQRSAIVDVTFPYLSLLSGWKLSNVIRGLFGDARVEDLWLEYYCLSVSLTGSRLTVHESGELWRHIRSSCSLPGIFPPVHTGEEVFVDGGVMNNLPTDVMAARCAGGKVIAIDVSGTADSPGAQFDTGFSGWGALGRKVTPFVRSEKTMTIFDVLLRSTLVGSKSRRAHFEQAADLYVRPPVADFGLLDFSPIDELYRIGYDATMKALEDWNDSP